jgi:hypothetical protein
MEYGRNEMQETWVAKTLFFYLPHKALKNNRNLKQSNK